MAKKKAAKKAVKKAPAKAASSGKKSASSPKATARTAKKAAPRTIKKVVKKKPVSDGRTEKPASRKAVTASNTAPVAALPASPTRKKGVRKATLTTGIRTKKPARKLGRSRIPVDAPLDVVFQNDMQAREAFVFLGVHTIRELEQFNPDDLVMRLTSPAKQTVGRIRKILAMNNRCLEGDESFALEFQERLSQSHLLAGR
ncbi:MAG: hypothetical protein KDA91_11070 [Planctomycetaceae bacterium]|nr:hypothetical protein [Planctomycetaceae bacterium]